MLKIEYDKEIDALYIRIQEKHVDCTKELEEGINVDIDEDNKVIGLEIIGAAERYREKDILNTSTENLILEDSLKNQLTAGAVLKTVPASK